MRKVLSPIFITILILTLSVASFALAGQACCSKDKSAAAAKCDEMKAAGKAGCPEMMGADSDHCKEMKAAGHAQCAEMAGMNHTITANATMGKVLTEKKLYSCPDHSSVISVHKDHSCPLDKQPLKKMGRRATKQLRKQELYGCPMCPVVKTAADEDQSCTLCGMDLIKIDTEQNKG